jgi:hypothetical protein
MNSSISRLIRGVACGLFLFGSPLAGQALSGSVRQDSGGRALSGVEVLLEGSPRQTTTDAAGRYVLGPLPSGNHVVLFRSVGFRPVRIRVRLAEGDTTRADAVMVRDGAQQLDPVEVKALPSGPRGIGREAFEERRRMGFGKFIDSTELRRNEERRVSDFLRGIPGVNMVRFRECDPPGSRRCGPVEERAGSGRGETSIYKQVGKDYCWMSVVVDGHILYRSGSHSPPPDFSRDFRVAEIESIEVYRSAGEVPAEYGGTSAACGVILLWTRRG